MGTVIGYTFNIPEAVMGLTFLGAGGCLPEAASAIIMGKKGMHVVFFFFVKSNILFSHTQVMER